MFGRPAPPDARLAWPWALFIWLAEWPERDEPPAWEASDDPSVLSACVLGATRYRMTTEPGRQLIELKLTATRVDDGSVVWEHSFGSFTPKAAPRLRP